MPYYPPDAQVTAVDLSEKMLAGARDRAQKMGVGVELCLMDAQKLEFHDATFDASLATFVFCSVPDLAVGFQELIRVVKPSSSDHLAFTIPWATT